MRLHSEEQKFFNATLRIPEYSMASIENRSLQQQPVQARPIGAAARMQACIAGTVAVLE